MSVTACAEPMALSVMIDHWLGDLAPDDEERVEEHLLGCASCSGRLRDLVALTAGVRALADDGLVRAVVTSAFIDSLIAEGFSVREYRLVPGGSAQCTVSAADDLVAAHLRVDLRDVERVDLVRCDADGRAESRLDDIPVSATAQEVVLLERMDRIRALPACVKRVKLIGHAAAGERLLGEYTFVHTPSGQH